MSKIREAQKILKSLGLPQAQQNEMAALTLLALCGIGPRSSWAGATRESLTVSKGIMAFAEKRYRRKYAPNTRETFRRQVLHQLVQASIAVYNPDDPSLPTNSPRAHYAISEDALAAICSFGTPEWAKACQEFLRKQGSLAATYRMSRASSMIPIKLPDGRKLNLSPGKHNELQVLVIREFAPRFLRAGRLVYLGDTAKKDLYLDSELLTELGVTISRHDKLPDVVLLDSQRAWVVLVEVVTSHGPMTPSRVMELRSMFSTCPHGLVFVSVFQDFMEFRKHLTDIAWETEVWIAEIPDHLIHYNGDRFLGPKG